MNEDRDRFEPAYAEIVYRLAEYGTYLRKQGFPVRAVGKRIQDEIRAGLLEEHSNDEPGEQREA